MFCKAAKAAPAAKGAPATPAAEQPKAPTEQIKYFERVVEGKYQRSSDYLSQMKTKEILEKTFRR